jgi:uncharacterized C2H2 Zn-finger protein
MNHVTQMRQARRSAASQLDKAKRRLATTEKQAREAAAAFQTAKEHVKTLTGTLTKIDEALKTVGETETPTKAKLGPKYTKIKAKAATKTGGKKPGPKAKAKPAKAAKRVNHSRAAEGRREVASGKRPPIKDTIAKVLGKRVMNSQQVYEAIKEKGQLPNSGDPRGYIGYLLSASKTIIKRGGKDVEVPLFERVPEKGRGFYKNRGVVNAKADSREIVNPKKAEPKKAAAKPAKAETPTKDGKRTVKCGKCGALGHNAKGHDKAVAAKETKAAPKAEAKTAEGKKTVKCGKCGALGHNAKGHDKFVAKNGGGKTATNGTNGHAEPATAEHVAAAEEKKDEDKSTDEILKEAGLDVAASPAL